MNRFKSFPVLVLLLIALLVLPAVVRADSGNGGDELVQTVNGYQITVLFDHPAILGENPIHIRVLDALHMPVSQASLEVGIVEKPMKAVEPKPAAEDSMAGMENSSETPTSVSSMSGMEGPTETATPKSGMAGMEGPTETATPKSGMSGMEGPTETATPKSGMAGMEGPTETATPKSGMAGMEGPTETATPESGMSGMEGSSVTSTPESDMAGMGSDTGKPTLESKLPEKPVQQSEGVHAQMTRFQAGQQNGEYDGQISITHTGDMILRVHLTVEGELMQADFPLHVEQSHAGPWILGGFAALNAALIAAAIMMKPKPVV